MGQRMYNKGKRQIKEAGTMGLLSKLLGDAGSELKLDKLVKTVADAAEKAARQAGNAVNDAVSAAEARQQSRREEPASPSAAVSAPAAVSGFSWGDEMPQEENQYNYGGSYIEYFEHVFREDFPGWDVVRSRGSRPDITVFTFRQAGRKALVVEVMTRRSEAQRLRRSCASEGVPYLRFYHDHQGWWNTRAYVSSRIRAVLR